MGSFSITCTASKLTVDYGDEVVLFPLEKARFRAHSNGLGLISNSGCFASWTPTLPLFGTYDDYGRVAMHDPTPFVNGVYKITHGEGWFNDMQQQIDDCQLDGCVILKEIWDSIIDLPDCQWKSYQPKFDEGLEMAKVVIRTEGHYPDDEDDRERARNLYSQAPLKSLLAVMGVAYDDGFEDDTWDLLKYIVNYPDHDEIKKLRSDFYDVYSLMHSNNRNFEICTTGPQWPEREDEKKLNDIIGKFLDKAIKEQEDDEAA